MAREEYGITEREYVDWSQLSTGVPNIMHNTVNHTTKKSNFDRLREVSVMPKIL